MLSSLWWRRADVLLCYAALRTEVQTAGLIEAALRRGLPVGVPRVVGTGLRFHAAPESESGYTAGGLGVREPAESSPPLDIEPGQQTLLIVPGLLFDVPGWRLGRGGGYYDRYLAEARARGRCTVVGLCFDSQLVELLPRDPWDEPVDGVVTELRGPVDCGRGPRGRTAP